MPQVGGLLPTEVRLDLLEGAGFMVATEDGGLVALVVFLMGGLVVVVGFMFGLDPVLLEGGLGLCSVLLEVEGAVVPCTVGGLVLLEVEGALAAPDILALRRGREGGFLLGVLVRPGAAPLPVGWGLGFFLVEMVDGEVALAPRRGWRGREPLVPGGLEPFLATPFPATLTLSSFSFLPFFILVPMVITLKILEEGSQPKPTAFYRVFFYCSPPKKY